MTTAEEQLRRENEMLRREIVLLRSQLSNSQVQVHSAAAVQDNGSRQTADNQTQNACFTCIGASADAPQSCHLQQRAMAAAVAAQPSSCSCPADTGGHVQPYNAVHGLSKEQVERYSRQILLPSFGVAAQGKLCRSSVLIVGCGGLGSPAALYLAAAGVGKIGLVDHDVVELSNMHRQVSHTEARLGMHKASSTAAAVAALNSSVTVSAHLEGLHPHNAVGIIQEYDVVIDASDNAPTRYLINDACVANGVPLVSAAAVGTDGQLTVYNFGAGCPCYRCLFPECPAAANCSRCADAGVLGPVPGVMGVLQAVEAIKVLTGVGQPLAGKLLLYDALAGRFNIIKLRGKTPGCIGCGDGGITKASVASYDYAAFTGGQTAHDGPPAPLAVLPAQQRLSAAQAAEQLLTARAAHHQSSSGGCQEGSSSAEAVLLLDVRPAEQFAVMAVPGAVNVPYLQFDKRFPEVLQLCGAGRQGEQQQPVALDQQQCSAEKPASGSVQPCRAKRVIVMCRRGNHSQLAVQRLHEAGIANVVDVMGGYEAWVAHVDNTLPVL